MLAFKIVALSFFPIINASCQCFEAITDRRDMYILYETDSTHELQYLSNFHGQYTLFEHSFKLLIKDTVITYSKAGGFATSLVMKDKRFYIREEFPSSGDAIILLKKKNCNRLKVNKIPKERILENPYPIAK